MNVRRLIGMLVTVGFAGMAWMASAQGPAPQRPASTGSLATVGPRSIPREEFEARAAAVEADFRQKAGGRLDDQVRAVIRRQLLESLIRLNLLMLEARRQNIAVAPGEAEAQLRQDPFFNPGGKFDEARFQAIRTTQPQQFQQSLAQISDRIAARRLNDKLERDLTPTPAEIRAIAARTTMRATYDWLPLLANEISGQYPEPRELEILDYHQEHSDEFQRPARATLSVAFANTPEPSESERNDPAALAAWTRRMRRTADSVLAIARGGTPLEQATAPLGGVRPGVVVTSENFPGYWRGTDAQNAALFRARPGTLLAEPIPAREGFLIVRVDETTPAGVAPLREVSRTIRGRLRADRRNNRDTDEARAIYAQVRDSLAGTAYRIRYVVVDPNKIKMPAPTDADLDRYYRGHLADYSAFDAKTGAITTRPFASVKQELRERWATSRRAELARAQADQLVRAWRTSGREPAIEATHGVRQPDPAPIGSALDTTWAGRALSDTLWFGGAPKGAGLLQTPGGAIVWQVTGEVPNWTPTLIQAMPALEELARRRRAVEEAEGARRLFDADPRRFTSGNVIHFTRVEVTPPPTLDVRLTRAEVERWFRANIDKYSAPELVRVRHILISPTGPGAAEDARARGRADSAVRVLREGGDFEALARAISDDPATRDKGGDLGVFGRGAMLEDFEREAFATRPGELRGPFVSSVGYHILKGVEYEPAVVQPLTLAYANVSFDAAVAKAESIAVRRADSLARAVRTPAQLTAAAQRFGYERLALQLDASQGESNSTVRELFEALKPLRPGQTTSRPIPARGGGRWLAAVDSVRPAGTPRWELARDRALSEYRKSAGERALRAKQKEIDSLLAKGWSIDSVGALWGGLQRVKDAVPGRGIPMYEESRQLDSLLFGRGTSAAALQPGGVSGWIANVAGATRIRLVERSEPDSDRLRERMDAVRRQEVDRGLTNYFETLKKRWPVRILDRRMAETPLPVLP